MGVRSTNLSWMPILFSFLDFCSRYRLFNVEELRTTSSLHFWTNKRQYENVISYRCTNALRGNQNGGTCRLLASFLGMADLYRPTYCIVCIVNTEVTDSTLTHQLISLKQQSQFLTIFRYFLRTFYLPSPSRGAFSLDKSFVEHERRPCPTFHHVILLP
jgi:hypothetical protein